MSFYLDTTIYINGSMILTKEDQILPSYFQSAILGNLGAHSPQPKGGTSLFARQGQGPASQSPDKGDELPKGCAT